MGRRRPPVSAEGRLQLRPRGPARHRRDPAAGHRAVPAAQPCRRAGRHRRRRPGVHRVPALRRRVRPGPAVDPARHREDPGRARVLGAGPAAGRRRSRAGAVRAGRQPGAGPVLQARRGGVDEPGCAHRPPRRCHRRRVLPGDGLAARRPRRSRKAGLRPGRGPAEPRSGPAVLRHHLHLLRGGGRRRGSRAGLARREDQRRAGRRPGQDSGIPHPRQVQGQPRRPAADRDRHGRHPRRHPRPGLVLARQHSPIRR